MSWRGGGSVRPQRSWFGHDGGPTELTDLVGGSYLLREGTIEGRHDMAIAEFGNTSTDMRLVNDFYGILALGNFVTYLENFISVQEQVVSQTPTQIVIREFNATGPSITLTATGIPPLRPFNTLNRATHRRPEFGRQSTDRSLSRPMATSSGATGAGRDLGRRQPDRAGSGINSPIDNAYFPADSASLPATHSRVGSGND